MSEPLVGEEIVTGRPASAVEEAIIAVNIEAVKQSIPRLNDGLSRLVTLSTAMTGGALAALKDDICTPWGRVTAAALFFVALAAAVVGALPYVSQVAWDMESMSEDVGRATRLKKRSVWVCCVFLALGALTAIIGAGVRAAYPLPK